MRDGKLRGSKYKHNQFKVNITRENGAKSKFYIQNKSISPTFHVSMIGENFPYLYKKMRSYLINESPWISPYIYKVTIKIGNDKTHVFLEFQYK